jgi:hypothetical protein
MRKRLDGSSRRLGRDSQWAIAHDNVVLRIVLNALVPVAKAASSKIGCHRLSDNAYVPEQDGRGSGSCRSLRPIRFQSTITANETKIGLHLRFQRLVPFNEQSAASESFPQHFEKSLHRLNIYENRLYKFARDWTFESHDCARTRAAIAQT